MADLSQRGCFGGLQAHAESVERLAGSGEQEGKWESLLIGNSEGGAPGVGS